MSQHPPLTDPIAVALARLVDDSQVKDKRAPSHSEIGVRIGQAGLSAADPAQGPKPVGKARRVAAVLNWAIEYDVAAGEALVESLIGLVKGSGGFRKGSASHCGDDAIANLISAFEAEGWDLSLDGVLQPRVLDALRGKELTAALRAYADRARRGALDSPLLAGTAKDLLEATAAHVLEQRTGAKATVTNFPTLLGQTFTMVQFATPDGGNTGTASERQRVERAAYELACALNGLRNKQGTGHGRPWVATVSGAEARFAIESMGNIASLLLSTLP
ncbi:abortive infection Abi-like protein [Luteibacter sp. OK325]|uniref:abortive infection family protein n=1 Tax=Luteibacter sp. OK325 TaxID=2135670 RepID=UPI000D360F54|nr:abortive infection family protein [Luteibacter sp. OK325]PTR30763.1 abortive infection Abi-like protein [Luteibacter sp. OK325]